MGRLERGQAAHGQVRLLLDEHLSGPRIGTPLRRRHDVIAIGDEPTRWGLPDEDVLELATAEGRIVVTCDGIDFVALARAWAEERHSHAGIIVLWGWRTDAFGAIVAAVEEILEAHPEQDAWVDLVLAI